MSGINFLRIILLLIIIQFISARDYFISFSFVSKNGKIIYNKFNCSNALSNIDTPKKLIFILPLKKNIKTTCLYYKDFIIDTLLKKGIYLYASDVLYSNYLKTRIKVTFLPIRFDIIIKDKRVYFYLKETE